MTSCNVAFGFLLLVDVPNILFMSTDFDLARLWNLRDRTGWGYKQATQGGCARGQCRGVTLIEISSDGLRVLSFNCATNSIQFFLKQTSVLCASPRSFPPQMKFIRSSLAFFFE
jgi:hypothetical protein